MWRWRWVGVAIVLLLIVQMLAPSAAVSRTEPVVVAARGLSAGQKVTEEDVKVAGFSEAIPGALTDPAAVVGSHLAVAVEAGSPVLQGAVMDSEFLSNAGAGHAIVSVALADTGGLAMVSTGTQVDLYSGPDDFSEEVRAELIARNITVAGIATEAGTKNLLSQTPDSRIYYLSIPQKEVGNVLGHAARSPLLAVLSGPVDG